MVSSIKPRTCRDRLPFLLTFLFTLCFFYIANAQELRIVKLDMDDGLFAIPSRIALSPGDSLQFVSDNGDFSIYIPDAINFLKMKDVDLKERVNSATDPESKIYQVREVDQKLNISYAIYCISNNSWPDAPPRIIIVVK